ncbi:hypothetical protein ADIARSV_0801 [Arcticibacter svalbardensis MN12-7]|uniref:TonB-dependent receptor-like beta-barrel domain-containing protein n=1 Tax=Arcticibacter svalbardensis MN12-7 TaxID=1150600 RepID=R9GWT1_9SPHI|nr:TonB-dependent receptor [Arcticibacter svalbardensis]EOR95985.1 hypothetical protein ADIARSV_0801 [Arcticibacter svalbardensis MN12-7]
MRTFLIFTLLFFLSWSSKAQFIVAGKIVNKNGNIISGASVYLKGSYDGTSSIADGTFAFKTTKEGKQVITIQSVGFKSIEQIIELTTDILQPIYVLYEDEKTLETVSIVAGSFDASDERKAVALKPMDIVTTASASGDIYGALSTLPGTQTVGETGKLFVRGGDDYEARTFIDGLQVESPYQQRLEGIPTKGRFSPMLFSGTFFSTGGYSAEYGQALSSVVLLKTDGAPASDKLNINLYSLGLGIAGTKKLKKSTYVAAFDYSNLGPYFKIVPQNTTWVKAPQTSSGSLNVINHIGSGLSKTLFSYNDDRSALDYPYYGYSKPNVLLALDNKNIFIKNSFQTNLSNGTMLKTGIGFSLDRNDLSLDSLIINDKFISGQIKVALVTRVLQQISLNYGGDLLLKNFDENIKIMEVQQKLGFNDFQSAFFTEAEYNLSSKLVFRVGVRVENSIIKDNFRLMPRMSAAYRISDHGQFSAAYGIFYQNPQTQYLKFTNELNAERADHFILNYQYKVKDRLFRIELFYKDYKNLITYSVPDIPDPANYANNGYGYAKGLDAFYRDSQSIKNGDFWISYSYLDTKKLYRDYLLYTTPKFFSKHNFNLVYKQWITELKSFIGISYTYAAGRPYYDANKPANLFLSDKTTPYHNLSVNYSYDLSSLTKIPVTFYFSVSNVFGNNNVYGYNNTFNSTSNKYDLIPVTPQANRFYLAALFISL